MMFAKCSIVSQNIVYSIIIVAGMLFISLSLQIVSILAGLKMIVYPIVITLKSASNLNGNLNCSKELEHYAS